MEHTHAIIKDKTVTNVVVMAECNDTLDTELLSIYDAEKVVCTGDNVVSVGCTWTAKGGFKPYEPTAEEKAAHDAEVARVNENIARRQALLERLGLTESEAALLKL